MQTAANGNASLSVRATPHSTESESRAPEVFWRFVLLSQIVPPPIKKDWKHKSIAKNATYQIVLPATYSCGLNFFLCPYLPLPKTYPSTPNPTLNLLVHTYPNPKPTHPHLPLP